MFDHLKLEFVAAIVGLIVPLLLGCVRRLAWRVLKGVVFMFTAPWKIAADLKVVKHQVLTNGGGSLKDAVLRVEEGQKMLAAGQTRLESYRQHDFWRQPRPGLEMDDHGQVNLASEAACRLFRVSDPDELQKHSWLRFLDHHHVGTFMQTFRETAFSSSIFRFVIRIRDEKGEDRGEWEFKATPIDAAEPKLYSGFFAPVDAAAKQIAGRANWQA